ncbi:hypothetical protein PH7735_00288 [Shimia thalassica]|uniref:DNA repair exonuclease n=1 Tax=Shimia thalassica TaxID=1715693 RepID=A0A0P1ILY7_9RHOB|nr:hypothetical protein PH7735_00288 [Shimia thalassica]
MVGFKFVHTSDLHLGNGFGTITEELRGRLIEARHGVVMRLVEVARGHGAQRIMAFTGVPVTSLASAGRDQKGASQ